MKKNVFLIGAGNIGSRHLQALKAVCLPLNIKVVDPNEANLATAKERWEAMPEKSKITRQQQVEFLNTLPANKNKIDLAIISTSANVRAKIIRELLKKNKVKYLLMEKILFQKKSDYDSIGRLLAKNKIKAWVNCSRRAMPWYQKLAAELRGRSFTALVSLGSFSLISNVIHYLDYFSLIADDNRFIINTSQIEKKLISSKRPEFKELIGTIEVYFKNNSSVKITSRANDRGPLLVYINTPAIYCLLNETTGQHLIARASHNWKLEKINSPLILQSQLTNKIVEKILKNNSSNLTPLRESSTIHLNFLEPILKHLNRFQVIKYKKYPFT